MNACKNTTQKTVLILLCIFLAPTQHVLSMQKTLDRNSITQAWQTVSRNQRIAIIVGASLAVCILGRKIWRGGQPSKPTIVPPPIAPAPQPTQAPVASSTAAPTSASTQATSGIAPTPPSPVLPTAAPSALSSSSSSSSSPTVQLSPPAQGASATELEHAKIHSYSLRLASHLHCIGLNDLLRQKLADDISYLLYRDGTAGHDVLTYVKKTFEMDLKTADPRITDAELQASMKSAAMYLSIDRCMLAISAFIRANGTLKA